MARIEIKNLSFAYENKKGVLTEIFSNVNIVFNDQRCSVIIGESGSGKTTLLRLITGMETPDEGNIYFDERLIDDLDVFKRKISYVSQNIALYPGYTIFRNIAFPLLIKKVHAFEIRQRVREIAKELGIECCLSRKPKHISLGQQQLACIARTIIKDSDVYIFDEPFSNLDKESKEKAKNLIRKHIIEKQKTCIFSTHHLPDVIGICDDIIIIKDKNIYLKGDVKTLLERKDPYFMSLLGKEYEE